MTIFLVLGLGHLLGRVTLGFFSVGSTAGALLVALVVGALGLRLAGVRFPIPDLLTPRSWRSSRTRSAFASGRSSSKACATPARSSSILVLVTTTIAFAIAYGGSVLFGLAAGLRPRHPVRRNTISAVMGVATTAVDRRASTCSRRASPPSRSRPTSPPAIRSPTSCRSSASSCWCATCRACSASIRWPRPRRARRSTARKGHALPGTSQAFERRHAARSTCACSSSSNPRFDRPAGRSRCSSAWARPCCASPATGRRCRSPAIRRSQRGDLLTVGGRVAALLDDVRSLGPEVADETARHLDVDQAEIVVTAATSSA